MNTKSLIFIGIFVGGVIGGYIPTLFGMSGFSITSILLSTLGSMIGILFAYKLSKLF